jgi:hypothetical protein
MKLTTRFPRMRNASALLGVAQWHISCGITAPTVDIAGSIHRSLPTSNDAPERI